MPIKTLTDLLYYFLIEGILLYQRNNRLNSSQFIQHNLQSVFLLQHFISLLKKDDLLFSQKKEFIYDFQIVYIHFIVKSINNLQE